MEEKIEIERVREERTVKTDIKIEKDSYLRP